MASSSDDDDETFDHTFTSWTQAEDQYLWEEYQKGNYTLEHLCRALGRYPDDVVLHMTERLENDPTEIRGFGSEAHLTLWREQQHALQTRPEFNLRRLRQQKEAMDRVLRLLQLLVQAPRHSR